MWENNFSEALVDDVIINIEEKLRDTYTSAMKGNFYFIFITI